ncbi:hypothetical protein L195_g037277, partial [Trifolium pratense]
SFDLLLFLLVAAIDIGDALHLTGSHKFVMLYVTSQRFGESSVSLCNSVLRDMIDSLQVVEVYNFLARWFFLQFSASKLIHFTTSATKCFVINSASLTLRFVVAISFGALFIQFDKFGSHALVILLLVELDLDVHKKPAEYSLAGVYWMFVSSPMKTRWLHICSESLCLRIYLLLVYLFIVKIEDWFEFFNLLSVALF